MLHSIGPGLCFRRDIFRRAIQPTGTAGRQHSRLTPFCLLRDGVVCRRGGRVGQFQRGALLFPPAFRPLGKFSGKRRCFPDRQLSRRSASFALRRALTGQNRPLFHLPEGLFSPVCSRLAGQRLFHCPSDLPHHLGGGLWSLFFCRVDQAIGRDGRLFAALPCRALPAQHVGQQNAPFPQPAAWGLPPILQGALGRQARVFRLPLRGPAAACRGSCAQRRGLQRPPGFLQCLAAARAGGPSPRPAANGRAFGLYRDPHPALALSVPDLFDHPFHDALLGLFRLFLFVFFPLFQPLIQVGPDAFPIQVYLHRQFWGGWNRAGRFRLPLFQQLQWLRPVISHPISGPLEHLLGKGLRQQAKRGQAQPVLLRYRHIRFYHSNGSHQQHPL